MIARLIAVIGAAASLVFMFRTGRNNTSSMLMVMFAGWIMLPFVGLAVAELKSKAWSPMRRATLQSLMLVLGVASPLLYSGAIPMPGTVRPAFIFLMFPLVSWAAMGISLFLASWLGRRRHDRSSAT